MNDMEVNAVTSDSGVVPIRHFDSSGRLIAAGTAWSELRKVPVWLTAFASLIVWFPTGFAFIAALAVNRHPKRTRYRRSILTHPGDA